MAQAHHILLVEDNPADVRLMREALSAGEVPKVIHVARTGDEADAYLSGTEPVPDLVFLDLNLPGKHGLEVLADIRRQPRLAPLPVIIFSSSETEEDVRRAYAASANCYVAKPGSLDRYFSVLAATERFWLSTARLPGPDPLWQAATPAAAEPTEPYACNHP